MKTLVLALVSDVSDTLKDSLMQGSSIKTSHLLGIGTFGGLIVVLIAVIAI